MIWSSILLSLILLRAVISAPIPENDVNIKHTITSPASSHAFTNVPKAPLQDWNEQEITPKLEESEAERELEDLLKEGRIGRLELSWWKKVKHSIEKSVKNLRDKVIDGLAGAIVGGIVG